MMNDNYENNIAEHLAANVLSLPHILYGEAPEGDTQCSQTMKFPQVKTAEITV